MIWVFKIVDRDLSQERHGMFNVALILPLPASRTRLESAGNGNKKCPLRAITRILALKIYEEWDREARQRQRVILICTLRFTFERHFFYIGDNRNLNNAGLVPVSHTEYTRRLLDKYETFQVSSFSKRHFPPDVFYPVVQRLTANSGKLLEMRKAGESFEGRPIYLVTAGTGPTKVFLWSQMHGDESTATMAICDILKYIITTKNEESSAKILSSLTLYFLPMLNPDGAQRTQRRTAQGIDMNRDALALSTPEANLLKNLQHELKPQFGFNLHDQELSTVTTSKELTALALLAPAFDAAKSENEVRRRARHLAAHLAGTLKSIIPNNLARYDDTFEPRAFGDNMQKWGTSTVLIESGHAMNDPEKEFIRKLNVVGLLLSFYALATGEYANSTISDYEGLPSNGKKVYDVIIRNVKIDHGNKKITPADLGISYQVDTHSTNTPTLADVGDLQTYIGLRDIDGKGFALPAATVTPGKEFDWTKFFH